MIASRYGSSGSGAVFVRIRFRFVAGSIRQHRSDNPDRLRDIKPAAGGGCLFDGMNDKFYNSARWRKHAQAIMSRDGYKDQIEARYGRAVPAELVHHILPLEDYPEHAWEPWNLISISRATHNRLHNEDGSLTLQGWKLADRTARLQGLTPPARPRGRNHTSSCSHYATK